ELSKESDGAIVARGPNPEADTYTIVARPALKEITALRLEALPDAENEGGGPGRASNGNNVLTEVRISAREPWKIKAAHADYSQDQYPVADAIDGKPDTGWAIYPEVGKPHFATFTLARPSTAAEGQPITVTLEFRSQWSRHQLGRFRLAATSSN